MANQIDVSNLSDFTLIRLFNTTTDLQLMNAVCHEMFRRGITV